MRPRSMYWVGVPTLNVTLKSEDAMAWMVSGTLAFTVDVARPRATRFAWVMRERCSADALAEAASHAAVDTATSLKGSKSGACSSSNACWEQLGTMTKVLTERDWSTGWNARALPVASQSVATVPMAT